VYVTDGNESIIIAHDPSGLYFPTIHSVIESDSRTLGVGKLAAPPQQGLTEIILALKLWSAITSVDDFIALYQNPPQLEKWGWLYEERCWTGEQLAQAFSVGMFAVDIIGVPGFEGIGRFFEVADQALLDGLRLSQFGAEYEIEQRLSQFKGAVRLRQYHAPIPILQPVGFCEDPPEESLVTPAPPQMSSDSLIVFRSMRDGFTEIYVMKADGSDQRRLTANNAGDDNPAWSPDGQTILFSSVPISVA
jgi:hypothetical protein